MGGSKPGCGRRPVLIRDRWWVIWSAVLGVAFRRNLQMGQQVWQNRDCLVPCAWRCAPVADSAEVMAAQVHRRGWDRERRSDIQFQLLNNSGSLPMLAFQLIIN